MASNVIGDLAVRVGADTTDFDKNMKKASKQLKQLGTEAVDGAKKLTSYAAAASAAGAVLTSALAAGAIKSAKEIQNLSRISNASASEFQAFAVASKSVGIEQEKLADIFKDMNDRVGDFITTGAGPMADFFEQIAPAVGVTAEEFRKLSGPQALQLYVDSLEKANVNQQEMTFFMEQLASDSTALLPLLRNNAEAFAKQAREAEELGLILSDFDIQAMSDASDQIDLTTQAFDSLVGKTTGELAPALTAVNKLFLESIREMGGMDVAAENMANNIIDATAFVIDAVEGISRTFEVAGKSVAVFALGVGESMLSVADFIINRPIEALNELIEALNEFAGTEIEPVGISNLGQAIQDELMLTRQAVNEGISDIHETLMRPMPSSQFEEFVANAIEANQAVLESNNMFREQELAAQDEFNTIMRQAIQEAGQWYTQFEQEQANLRSDIAKQEAESREAATGQMFSDLSSLMNSESRKMFQIGKAAAISDAVISTIEGAQKAYTSLAGIPIVGPALGIAAAGAAVAAGTVRVNAIRSRQFSSSGGVSAGATGSSAGSVSAPVSAGVSGGSVENSRTVSVQGLEPGQLFTGEQIIDLVNNAQENGARLVIL